MLEDRRRPMSRIIPYRTLPPCLQSERDHAVWLHADHRGWHDGPGVGHRELERTRQRCQHQDCLRHAELRADANARSSTERKIGETRRWRPAQEPLRTKYVGLYPATNMAVKDPGNDHDQRAAGDLNLTAAVPGDRAPRDDECRRIESQGFADDSAGKRQMVESIARRIRTEVELRSPPWRPEPGDAASGRARISPRTGSMPSSHGQRRSSSRPDRGAAAVRSRHP